MRIGVIFAASLLAAGCASSSVPDARAAAERYVTEARDGNGCELLAPRAQADCRPPRLDGRVGAVAVWGDESVATVGTKRIYLHLFDDGWRVTGAGCEGEPATCEVGGP